MSAFVEAVEAEGAPGKKKKDGKEGSAKKGEEKADAQASDVSPALRQAILRAKELSGGSVKTAPVTEGAEAKHPH